MFCNRSASLMFLFLGTLLPFFNASEACQNDDKHFEEIRSQIKKDYGKSVYLIVPQSQVKKVRFFFDGYGAYKAGKSEAEKHKGREKDSYHAVYESEDGEIKYQFYLFEENLPPRKLLEKVLYAPKSKKNEFSSAKN